MNSPDTVSSSSSDLQQNKSVSIEATAKADEVELRHRRFVSRHRQVLDFIKTDSAESRAHTVPSHGPSSNNGARLSRMTAWPEKKSASQWMAFLCPALSWLQAYDYKQMLSSDIIAGLTVGVMIVPQSMSYAKLA